MALAAKYDFAREISAESAENSRFRASSYYFLLPKLEAGEIYAEYTTDGGHLTPEGYDVLTNTITPTLEMLLGK